LGRAVVLSRVRHGWLRRAQTRDERAPQARQPPVRGKVHAAQARGALAAARTGRLAEAWTGFTAAGDAMSRLSERERWRAALRARLPKARASANLPAGHDRQTNTTLSARVQAMRRGGWTDGAR